MASITINPTYNQSSINITGEEKLLTVGKNGTSTVSINQILNKIDDQMADRVEDQVMDQILETVDDKVNEKIDEVVDNISNLNWNDV